MTSSYSILLTAFWLSFWIPVDWIVPIYHAWVFVVIGLYQRIYFLAGGTITDTAEFWGWQYLITFIGILIGVTIQWITMPPPLLSTRHGWESDVFIKFPILTLLYLAAQIWFLRLPPPDNPWGILLTILSTTVIIVIAWAWSYDQPWRDRDTVNTYMFWLWIFAVNFMLQAFHFLLYTSLESKWVSIIAAGGTLILLIISQVLISGCWNRNNEMNVPWWRRFSSNQPHQDLREQTTILLQESSDDNQYDN